MGNFAALKNGMEMDVSWLVVYISSRQEKKVANELSKLGIDHYLPLAKKLRQWSDRKKWVEFPMFNGYLFVKPTPAQVDRVLQVNGVVCYLTFEGKHAVVRNREIEIIRQIETSGYFAETMMRPDEFEAGEMVLITDGPLKGQVVELIRKNNEKIFLIAFDTLGQSVKMNIPFELIQKTKEEV